MNTSREEPPIRNFFTASQTIEEVEQNMREAIEFHLEGMRLHGDPIPEPSTLSLYVDVAA